MEFSPNYQINKIEEEKEPFQVLFPFTIKCPKLNLKSNENYKNLLVYIEEKIG